jgi:hypothetical protein
VWSPPKPSELDEPTWSRAPRHSAAQLRAIGNSVAPYRFSGYKQATEAEKMLLVSERLASFVDEHDEIEQYMVDLGGKMPWCSG